MLRIQSENVPFLAESEIPEYLRSTKLSDDQVNELEANLKRNNGTPASNVNNTVNPKNASTTTSSVRAILTRFERHVT